MYADDITIPLGDGSIVVHAEFHETTELAYKVLYPDTQVYDLVYRIKNQTSSGWRAVRLRFDFGGLCAEKPKQWSIPISVHPLAYIKDFQFVEYGTQAVSSSLTPIKLNGVSNYGTALVNVALPLSEDLTGCTVEIVKAVLLSAENEQTAIAGASTELPDMSVQLRAIYARKEAEAHEQAKTDAAEAARQERLAAEQRRIQTEADARYAKMKAVENAKAVEERWKLRATCKVIYQNTIDTKVKDLTVREDQQVRTCQALGLYPPQ